MKLRNLRIWLLLLVFVSACSSPPSSSEPDRLQTHAFSDPAEDEPLGTACPGYGITGLAVLDLSLRAKHRSETIKLHDDKTAATDIFEVRGKGRYLRFPPELSVFYVRDGHRQQVKAIGAWGTHQTREGLGVGTTLGDLRASLAELADVRPLTKPVALLKWAPPVGSYIWFPNHGYRFYFEPAKPSAEDKVVAYSIHPGRPNFVYEAAGNPLLLYSPEGEEWRINGLALGLSSRELKEQFPDFSGGEDEVETKMGRVRIKLEGGKVAELSGAHLSQGEATLVEVGDVAERAEWVLEGDGKSYPFSDGRFSRSGSMHLNRADSSLDVVYERGRVSSIKLRTRPSYSRAERPRMGSLSKTLSFELGQQTALQESS